MRRLVEIKVYFFLKNNIMNWIITIDLLLLIIIFFLFKDMYQKIRKLKTLKSDVVRVIKQRNEDVN